jgi:hypothetical protein
MLFEHVNCYLNKGLQVMANERSLVHIAMEAILLLLYAWNSAPIPGTDLSRCSVASSDFLSTSQWISTGNSLPLQLRSNHI